MLITATPAHHEYLPGSVANLETPQTDIPRIAKDKKLLKAIESAVQQILASPSKAVARMDDVAGGNSEVNIPSWYGRVPFRGIP